MVLSAAKQHNEYGAGRPHNNFSSCITLMAVKAKITLCLALEVNKTIVTPLLATARQAMTKTAWMRSSAAANDAVIKTAFQTFCY